MELDCVKLYILNSRLYIYDDNARRSFGCLNSYEASGFQKSSAQPERSTSLPPASHAVVSELETRREVRAARPDSLAPCVLVATRPLSMAQPRARRACAQEKIAASQRRRFRCVARALSR